MGVLKDKKIIIIVGVLIISSIIGIIIYRIKSNDDSDCFEKGEKGIFRVLSARFKNYDKEDSYEILSMDAYYYDDGSDNLATCRYYYRIRYNAYLDVVKTHYEKDVVFGERDEQVQYEFDIDLDEEGKKKHQDQIKDYEAAVEKGKHKSYTKEEIEKGIEKYKVED